ncbi:hypothetical protein A3J44_01520 [candidate division WOR-1 bacterium RIFCSPHIGHO2_02_FULL_45_12]|nr:MAG: hypothetical protein A3J44_01520 [candidate division WOR-1 bacterium RIFCSPHIGHO2_02_FULL_45_12]
MSILNIVSTVQNSVSSLIRRGPELVSTPGQQGDSVSISGSAFSLTSIPRVSGLDDLSRDWFREEFNEEVTALLSYAEGIGFDLGELNSENYIDYFVGYMETRYAEPPEALSDAGFAEAIDDFRAEIREYENQLPRRLLDEIAAFKVAIETANPVDLPALVNDLGLLEQAQETIVFLDALEAEHPELSLMIRRAKCQIIGELLRYDQAVFDRGRETLALLVRYQQIAERRTQIYEIIQSEYPLHSAATPSREYLASTTVSQVLGELQLEHMDHMDSVFEDLRGSRALPVFNSNAEFEAYIAGLEGLYLEPQVETFMARLGEVRAERLSENDGYQNRLDLQESLEYLEEYATILETVDLSSVELEVLAGYRDMLLSRAAVYRERLESQIPNAIAADVNSGDRFSPSDPFGTNAFIEESFVPEEIPPGPREEALRAEIAQLDATVERLEQLDFSQAESLPVFTDIMQQMANNEEAYVRDLLETELDQVVEIPSTIGSGEVVAARGDFERIDPSSRYFRTISDRLAAYQRVMARLDTAALLSNVDYRLSSLREMRETVATSNRIENTLFEVITVGQADLEVDEARQFDYVIGRYEEIEIMIEEGRLDEARNYFLEMNNSAMLLQLEDVYDSAAAFNTYVVGTGIVIAAAFTSGIAAELTGAYVPAFLGSTGSSIVYYGTEAVVFTVTSRGLHSWIYDQPFFDPNLTFEENLLQLGEETLLAAGMFAFLRGAGSIFTRYTRDLAPLAERNFWLRNGLRAGAFVTELGAFGVWDFLSVNYQQVAHEGVFDPIEAAEETLSLSAWRDRTLFLLSLKVGNALASPIVRPIHEAARGRSVERLRGLLEESDTAINDAAELLQRYGETGEGDFMAIIRAYRSALRARSEALERIPQLRDPRTFEQVERLIRELDAIEAEYTTIIEPLLSENNDFGVVLTNRTSGTIPAENVPAFLEALRSLEPVSYNDGESYSYVDNLQVQENGPITLITFDYQGPSTNGRVRTYRFYTPEAQRGISEAEVTAVIRLQPNRRGVQTEAPSERVSEATEINMIPTFASQAEFQAYVNQAMIDRGSDLVEIEVARTRAREAYPDLPVYEADARLQVRDLWQASPEREELYERLRQGGVENPENISPEALLELAPELVLFHDTPLTRELSWINIKLNHLRIVSEQANSFNGARPEWIEQLTLSEGWFTQRLRHDGENSNRAPGEDPVWQNIDGSPSLVELSQERGLEIARRVLAMRDAITTGRIGVAGIDFDGSQGFMIRPRGEGYELVDLSRDPGSGREDVVPDVTVERRVGNNGVENYVLLDAQSGHTIDSGIIADSRIQMHGGYEPAYQIAERYGAAAVAPAVPEYLRQVRDLRYTQQIDAGAPGIYERPLVSREAAVAAGRPELANAPGALLEIEPGRRVIMVGDLHANVENLRVIVDQYRAGLEDGSVVLVFLGDAIHPENYPAGGRSNDPMARLERYSETQSSIDMIDAIMQLRTEFPDLVHYVRGNHDVVFGGGESLFYKGGVMQGELLREALLEARGEEYVRELQAFFESCPLAVIFQGTEGAILAGHTPVVAEGINRQQLVDARLNSDTERALMWSRPNEQYSNEDLIAMRDALGLPEDAVIVAGHTPNDEQSAYVPFGMDNHIIVHGSYGNALSVVEVSPEGRTRVVDLRGESGLANREFGRPVTPAEAAQAPEPVVILGNESIVEANVNRFLQGELFTGLYNDTDVSEINLVVDVNTGAISQVFTGEATSDVNVILRIARVDSTPVIEMIETNGAIVGNPSVSSVLTTTAQRVNSLMGQSHIVSLHGVQHRNGLRDGQDRDYYIPIRDFETRYNAIMQGLGLVLRETALHNAISAPVLLQQGQFLQVRLGANTDIFVCRQNGQFYVQGPGTDWIIIQDGQANIGRNSPLLPVGDSTVSGDHLTIEIRGENIVLIDHSTNGSVYQTGFFDLAVNQ